jgi:hypothetical protein
MLYGSVKNVVPKTKGREMLGGDMYPIPRKELTYPLKEKNYPQYSPSGGSIIKMKNNLQSLQHNKNKNQDDLHIDLGEYEKTVSRRM